MLVYIERSSLYGTRVNRYFSIEWAGRKLTVEIGQFAKQANGAVLVRYGDTAVLSTATASKEPKTCRFLSINSEL